MFKVFTAAAGLAQKCNAFHRFVHAERSVQHSINKRIITLRFAPVYLIERNFLQDAAEIPVVTAAEIRK